MSNIIDISGQAALEQEAATWVTKLDGSKLPAAEFTAFRDWVSTSEAHRTAFEKIANVWGELDILSELDEALPAIEMAQKKSKLDAFWGSLMPRPSYAFAGLVAVVAIGLSWQNINNPNNPVAEPAYYVTDTGESKTVALADGSDLLLNTASQIEVQYSEDKRILKLLKGEAHFDVAHNPERPFEVHAGTNIVRAIGTAFSVELRGDTVEVTVTEGRVELAALSETDGQNATVETSLALLNSGQSAQFSSFIQSVETIAMEEMDRKLAWHKGGLAFEGDSLAQVVAEVSRYTDTKIVISDPALRDLKIGGYFRTDAPEAMLEALSANFGVSVEWVGEDLVYLSQSSSE
jgi:transmembrane sensor